MPHRVRLMLVRQRTKLINAIRAHLAEFGVDAPSGRQGVEKLLATIDDSSDERIPLLARRCLAALSERLSLVEHMAAPTSTASASTKPLPTGRRPHMARRCHPPSVYGVRSVLLSGHAVVKAPGQNPATSGLVLPQTVISWSSGAGQSNVGHRVEFHMKVGLMIGTFALEALARISHTAGWSFLVLMAFPIRLH
jgi:hypothetical protein